MDAPGNLSYGVLYGPFDDDSLAVLTDGSPFLRRSFVQVRPVGPGTDGSEPAIEIEIVVEHGSPVVAGFAVRRSGVPDARPVAAGDVYDLPVASIIEEAIASAASASFRLAATNGDLESAAAWTAEARESAKLAGDRVTAQRRRRVIMTDDLLREVAAIVSTDKTRAPTIAVKNRKHVSHRTATRWIGQAREAGYLPPLDSKED